MVVNIGWLVILVIFVITYLNAKVYVSSSIKSLDGSVTHVEVGASNNCVFIIYFIINHILSIDVHIFSITAQK